MLAHEITETALKGIGGVVALQVHYMLKGVGNYILEFKFNEKWWGVDATKEDGSMRCLINHSKRFKNIKLVLKVEQGEPIIKFISLRQIAKDEELTCDYLIGHKSQKNISHG